MNSRKVLKKWDSGFIQKRRNSQQPEHIINSDTQKELEVEDMKIEILTRNESVNFSEIKNRIRAAWATFRKYRQESTSKNYMLKHRLRLFDAAISPTICYAAGTWTPNKKTRKIDSIDAT